MRYFGWCCVCVTLVIGLVGPVAAQSSRSPFEEAGDYMAGSSRQAQSGFIVEEHPLVAATEDNPDHFSFREHLTADMLDARRAWREPDPAAALVALNAAITPSGYQVEFNNDAAETYTIYQGDTVLFADVTTLYPLALSASGADFRLLFLSMSEASVLEMTPETVGTPDADHYVYIPPVFVGEDLIEVWTNWSANLFEVRRADEVIYTLIPETITLESPIKALWSWNGQWVLEADGHVIIDGADITEASSASEMFAWQLVRSQPFYFVNTLDPQSGKEQITMSYAGQDVPSYAYDQVVHYQCCLSAVFNPDGNDSMVWFYGLRAGVWYYVEAGVYG